MMHIFIIDDQACNVDNDADATALRARGARELSSEEIADAGMVGYEHLVSPANTSVDPDGRISFSPPAGPSPEQARAAKREAILSGYEAALTAGLTMPSAQTPASTLDLALAIADWQAEAPEDFADLRAIHAARRDELLAAVDAAETVEAVQAVEVSYAV